MPRHLLEQSVDHLAAMAAPPASTAMVGARMSVHTGTLIILAAVLCFLLCVVGLALAARCSGLCNPSAFSVDDAPGATAKEPSKGMKKKALQSLPTVSWRSEQREEEEGGRPECAICLAEFARGDEVRALPTCGHGFHAACVDVWLLSSSTCPSCRRALVVPAAFESPPPETCCERADHTGWDASTCDLSFVG